MELITITEAAQRAGVTDKTLRRAIEAGKLVAQPRVYKNQPVMIAEQDLEQWLASRSVQIVVQSGSVDPDLASRLAELEQTVQRLQEQVEIDHKLAYSRIDVLEKRQRALEIALQDTQDLLVKQQSNGIDQDLESSRERTKDLVEREKAGMASAAQTSTPAPDQETTFELADFSQLMLHEYRSSAVRGDVRAWLTLRPNPQTGSGAYSADYWSYDKADKTKKGTMSKVQKERGEQLKQDLKTAVLHALGQSGWKEIMYGVYACPDS